MVYRKVAEVLSKDLLFLHSLSKSQVCSAGQTFIKETFAGKQAENVSAACPVNSVEGSALKPFRCSSQISLEGST